MNRPTDVRLEYNRDDNDWCAVLIRDGQPWYLDGALVGIGDTWGEAVDDLAELMRHLARHGENFLTPQPLSLPDRVWLFSLIDHGVPDDETYAVLRTETHAALRTDVSPVASAGTVKVSDEFQEEIP